MWAKTYYFCEQTLLLFIPCNLYIHKLGLYAVVGKDITS